LARLSEEYLAAEGPASTRTGDSLGRGIRVALRVLEVLCVSLLLELRQLGIQLRDVVMVHASMRAVGGRAEQLVQSLVHAVGEDGTVMAYVDFEPSEGRPDFDITASPAAADHGVLAEVIRRWPGALRSANPGASMAAIGTLAEWLCSNHPLRYGYGPGSPLEKLLQAHGKVLLLGSHFDHVTLLHYAEHLARLPNKRVVRSKVRASGVDLEIEEFDTSDGVVESMPDLYFDQIVREFVAAGRSSIGRVGNATSHLLRASDLVSFAVEKMERELGGSAS
jgi:aminoglycoside 3-N-acetyltransferase